MTPDPARMPLVIAKVEAAIVALEILMLDDAWEAVPGQRQRAIAKAVEAMRVDVARLWGLLRLDVDSNRSRDV